MRLDEKSTVFSVLRKHVDAGNDPYRMWDEAEAWFDVRITESSDHLSNAVWHFHDTLSGVDGPVAIRIAGVRS